MSNADGTVDDTDSVAFRDFVQGLHANQLALLEALATASDDAQGVDAQADGPAIVQTSYLSSTTDLPNSLVGHHAKRLVSFGLAEQVDQRAADDPESRQGPLPENRYRLTEDGVAAAGIADGFTAGMSPEALRAEIERQREVIERLESNFEKIATGHNDLVDELEDEGILN